MKPKKHHQFPVFRNHESANMPLRQIVRETLLDAGYHVKGMPEVWNGHQAFAVVDSAGTMECFAGQFFIDKEHKTLKIAGGLESELDETASVQLAHATPDLLRKLSPDREKNIAFLERCDANNQRLGKGTFVSVNPVALNVSEQQELRTLLITDGQRSTGALIENFDLPTSNMDLPQTGNGKQVFYPKNFSKLLTPVLGLININNFTIPKESDRIMAAAFCIKDLGINEGRFTANLINGNRQTRNDADVLAVFQNGEFKGSIAGDSAINAAIERMGGHNKKNGYKPEVLVRNGRPDLTVPHDRVTELIKGLENNNAASMPTP